MDKISINPLIGGNQMDYSEMSVLELQQLEDELNERLQKTDDASEEMDIIMQLEEISDAIIDAEERELDEEEDE